MKDRIVLVAFDFVGALAEIRDAMADMGRKAEFMAASAQAFHDHWHAVAEAEWRGWFYRHPEDAWWEA